ncbi:hypothetical protein FQN57_005555 [Myotisia sp. PD_48]|nr:hypothetical protein FQN57_005555 [Myotisia sp. PD_48]
MADTAIKRLHIRPLDPAILEKVLPPTIRPLATDISFHSVKTFPEHDFGFVTLPALEADKITRKLNGSILKGTKLKIQEARSCKALVPAESETPHPQESDQPQKRSKRKFERGVIQGYKMPPQRTIARGWTENASSCSTKARTKAKGDNPQKRQKRNASQYSTNAECLFRTVLSPNSEIHSVQSEKKKHAGKGSVSTLVHEFEHSTRSLSFLKTEETGKSTSVSVEYVDGKGWMDREGKITQVAPKPNPDRPFQAKVFHKPKPAPTPLSSTDEPSADADTETTMSKSPSPELRTTDTDDETSSAGSSDETSGADSSDETSSNVSSTPSEPAVGLATAETQSRVTSSVGIHPLESLFKRPAKDLAGDNSNARLKIDTQFTFFGTSEETDSNDEDGIEEGTQMHNIYPQTPVTKRDLQARGLRSGAPTPDTALPTGKRFWKDDVTDNIEESDEETQHTAAVHKKSNKTRNTEENSDFMKWFWENRGDNNRAWKRRRRESAKEKRQSENRKGARGRRH